MADAALLATLGKVQDDLVYVIEELLFDYSGEAKSELADILNRLDGQEAVLGAGFTAGLRRRFEAALGSLRDRSMRDTFIALVGLRRGLRNCQLQLLDLPVLYPYGEKLGLPGAE